MRVHHIIVAALAIALPAAAAEPSRNPADAPAGHYAMDPRHTSVIAKVRHMGLSYFTMRLDRVEAAYDYDPAHPEASRLSVTIDARSLDTGDAAVSRQFAGEFLDADHNPMIRFASTGIEMTDANHGAVDGTLTFRGVTKPVTLQVTYNGTDASLIGGRRMGFSAVALIRRSDFGSTNWRSAVDDEVQVIVETEFVRK